MIKDFNDDWIFYKGGDGVPVTLPHDAMLTEKRYAACRNGVESGYFPGGKYRYEKKFDIGKGELGKKIELIFGGVYRNASVFVNGKEVGGNKYGYGSFSVDISNAVHLGQNEVAVTVDNSLYPNCRWYSGSGIYRPVYLSVTSFGAPTFIRVTTVDYTCGLIQVDSDGDKIEIFEGDKKIFSGAPGQVRIQNFELWSAENPKLYRAVAIKNNEIVETDFGIRSIGWSAENGFMVNGVRTLLRGGCVHHDNGVLGACEYAAAAERRVRILKEQGFNALRISHNPASQELLSACDKIGMYVLDEAFDGWYTPKTYHDFSRDFMGEYEKVLQALVEKDYNHPSVIMYSIGNEVSEIVKEKGVELAKNMADILRNLDGTRPVTCGVNALLCVYTKMGFGVYKDKGEYKPEPLPEGKNYKEKKTGSAFFNFWTQKLGGIMFFMSKGKTADKIVTSLDGALDITGLNYASSRYDKDVKKHPTRVMVGTETLSGDLPYNWERVKKYPQLIGDFVWSAWDYLGETCMGWTYQSYKGLPLLANQGMIDITGKPLAQMAFMQVVWGLRKEPFICVRPFNHSGETPSKGGWQFTDAVDSWSWAGFEGKKSMVEVYSDASKIELLLNGKKIGCKKIKNFKAIFKRVKYVAGKIEAVALDRDGKELSRSELSSAGEETVLSVKADKTTLSAEGDLCYIDIEFTDNNGVLKPYIEQRVDIKVDGGAELIGFGSALYKTDEVFDKTYHFSYRGRVQAVIRAGKAKGDTIVTVKSDGVEPVAITIKTE